MEDLKDKVALITGGTKGIGRGIAEALLHQGMKVAITGRDEKSTKEAATELTENDNYILGVAADVRDYDSQQAAVKATLDKFGKID
ncbi:MAG: SDR family NAD(P)-dependent oxidoreductase, partial [Dokdonia donghaensis]|nr:SDR family NAD(P)-dependent oxidoreductase [Dokdonia donghaensis]